MNWKILFNGTLIKTTEIPELGIKMLTEQIINRCAQGARIAGFFGKLQKDSKVRIFALLADDSLSQLLIASSVVDKESEYDSMCGQGLVSSHMFERELFEEFGIIPKGHPWLKPVRYPYYRHKKENNPESYPFYKVHGEQIHEVAVGPVHAGIIEPGHFRFMCSGEDVKHLEIQLGYQHRGVEKLFEKGFLGSKSHLAESIVGDSVIGHAMAYASVVESLSGLDIPRASHEIRAIALEMERLAVHTGGLGAIASDIGYLPGLSVFGANRTTIINSLLLISGSRFGRGLVRPGGVVFGINEDLAKKVKSNLAEAFANICMMAEHMFTDASVMSRMESTGTITNQEAVQTGMIGFAARASGVSRDVRVDHPMGAYVYYPVVKHIVKSGDVFGRTYLRYLEIVHSFKLVNEMIDNLFVKGPLMQAKKILPAPESLVVSMVEGWRGEIIHIAITDSNGNTEKYKVKDPSFNNWYALVLAVRGNGISDFPLCNKSFDFSYSGNDL